MNPITIRPATPADRAAVLALRARSLRGLGRGHLSLAAIEAVVAVDDIDDRLLGGGTYLVALMGNRVVGAGGWSLDAPGFGRAIGGVVIHGDPLPTVRGLYVDPVCAGHGLGRRLLARVEGSIVDAGWRRAVLTASPMGLGFYERQGWRRLADVTLDVAGHAIPSHEMDKIVLPGALSHATNPGVRAGARAA